jgi:hypothetical protein
MGEIDDGGGGGGGKELEQHPSTRLKLPVLLFSTIVDHKSCTRVEAMAFLP